VEGVESEPSFAPRFGMEVNSDKPDEQGTEVVFSNDAGTQIASATFGKKLGSSESSEQGGTVGRFVRNNADQTGVYKVAELFPTLSATPSAWLDQQFLTIEKIKDIAVSKPGKPENDWTLTRPDEDAEFTLVDKQTTDPLDPAVTGALKTLFSSSTFTDIVLPDKVAESEDPATKRTVEITTTEGFNYKLTIAQGTTTETKPDENGQPPEGGYLVTVDVTGTIPAERKKGDKESEADAKAKDAAFTDRKSVLEKRLADQKSLAGRTFKVSSWTVEAVVKNRSELIKKPTPPAGQAGRGPQGLQGLQGLQGIPGMPPQGGGAPARRPVQAVTPPVAIPPSEDDGGGEDCQ
ncbi:MAG: hypothetical protein JWO82_3303, partial [Akkermansiaceae bacterium]|nr:hypothetical protein [Akkermansiaceae bacterium]